MLASELTRCWGHGLITCRMLHSLDFAEAQAPMRRRADAAWRSRLSYSNGLASDLYRRIGATLPDAFMAVHASWLYHALRVVLAVRFDWLAGKHLLHLIDWVWAEPTRRMSTRRAAGTFRQGKSQSLLTGDAEAMPRRGLRRPGWSMECGQVAAWEW
jgi:hypothetical protein